MAAGEAEVRIRRVVACYGPGTLARPEAAARLARELQAEFLGLFVEDVELLRFASLPFAREVGLASASLLTMNLAALERQMRAQAQRLEAALQSVFGPAPGWSFRIERASPASAVEAALAEGHAPALLIPPGANLLRPQRQRARRAELTPAALRRWWASREMLVILPD